jgi:hypothetical protein
MNFYFCEKCGKRVTELDIEAGKARDKKFNGVFCATCAQGVLTQENLAITDEDVKKYLGDKPPAAAATVEQVSVSKPAGPRDTKGRIHLPETSAPKIAPVARTTHGHSQGHLPRAKQQSNAAVIGAGVGAAVIVLVLGLVLTGGNPPPREKPVPPKDTVAHNDVRPPPPNAFSTRNPAPEVRVPAPVEKPPEPAPVVEPAKPEPAPTLPREPAPEPSQTPATPASEPAVVAADPKPAPTAPVTPTDAEPATAPADQPAASVAPDPKTDDKAAMLRELREAALAALRQMTGKKVTLKKGDGVWIGTVQPSADEMRLTLKLSSGPDVLLTSDQLALDDAVLHAPLGSGPAEAEGLRRRGILYLDAGDASKAKGFLLKAKERGLADAAVPYLALIETIESELLEKKAKESWDRAEAHYAQRKFRPARDAYESFAQEYEKSRVMLDNYLKLRDRIEAIDRYLSLLPMLQAQYFKSPDLKPDTVAVQRYEPKIDYNWGLKPPVPEVPKDNFSIRWTGVLVVTKPGEYTIGANSDDGVRVNIGTASVINDFVNGAKLREGRINLGEGAYDLKVEHFDGNTFALCKLSWALKDGFADCVIPPEALFHTGKREQRAFKLPDLGVTYLSDMQEGEVAPAGKYWGKKGVFQGGKVTVADRPWPNALYTHPVANGNARVCFQLGKKFRVFRTMVAISDEATLIVTPLNFKVAGDGKPLWQSKPTQQTGRAEECAIDVTGVDKLELTVECPGSCDWAHAVWLDPFVK